MSRTPCFEQLFRNRQHAPLRHSRAADRAGVLQDEHVVRRHRRDRDHRCAPSDRRSSSNTTRRPGVLEQARLRRRRFDHRAVGSEIAAQNEGATGLCERAGPACGSHPHCRLPRPRCSRPASVPVTVSASRSQQARDAASAGRGSPPAIVKILHQIFAGRPQIRDQRHLAARFRRSAPASARFPRDRAIAMRWTMALVDPPSAMSATMALSKDLSVRMSLGFRSVPHHLDDAPPASPSPSGRGRNQPPGSTTAPGRHRPSTSASAVMVEAVPIVMQVPGRARDAVLHLAPVPSHKLPALAFRPSIATRPSRCRASRRASCPSSSGRPA